MSDTFETFTGGESDIAEAARIYAGRAQDAATATGDDARQTGEDRIATSQDRVATGQDRTATGQDRTATGQDRTQTGLDRTATGQDRTATGQDRAATLADRQLADADALATAADRLQTGLDRTAAAASATAAAALVPVLTDRVVGSRLGAPSIWVATRSTVAWVRGPAGVLVPAPADTLPPYYDANLAPKGPAFAAARTNLFVNPRFEGFTPGVIGSGGVLPANSGIGTPATGVSYQVVGAGTLADGSPYFDLRYFGTLTAGSPIRFITNVPAGIVLAANDPLTYAMGYQLVGGSLTGFASATQRLTGILSATPTVPLPTAAINRPQRTIAATGGTTASNYGLEFLWSITVGATIDATIRYILPNLQRGSLLGSTPLPPVGSPSSFTEAQTSADIDITKLGVNWNYRQGTIIIDWSSRSGPFTSALDADWFGLVSWGDGSANERLGLMLNPAHTSIEARLTAGGVVQAAASRALVAPAADATTRAALSWDLDAGKLQVAARGNAGAGVALTALPVPGKIMPGRFGTTHPGFVCIAGLEVRPAATFDAALAALAT